MNADPYIDVAAIEGWASTMGVQALMASRWGWPITECFHFIGLVLLFGAVGFFDLRLLGVVRGISLRALHRLIPFGVAGFALSAVTGSLFVMAAPDQYLHNPAFLVKVGLMLTAGVNMALFYAICFRTDWLNDAQQLPPLRARVLAAVSLLCWTGVMTCGRVITAFRPSAFYWCPWC